MVRQLLDVVHHAIELPLPIHLRPAPQGEAGEPFVVAQVAEHRFHRRKASRNHVLAGGRVDLRFHPVGMALLARTLALEECDLPGLGGLGFAQALLAQRAGHAVPLGPAEFHRGVAVESAALAVAVEAFADRKNAVTAVFCYLKVGWRKALSLL